MSVSGWFPRLRNDGVIASGNGGIWITPLSGAPYQVSPVGIGPIWAAHTLVFNRNDNTTFVGIKDAKSSDIILPIAYVDYAGSDDGQWAGFRTDVGLQRYLGAHPIGPPVLDGATGRFLGPSLGYLAPYAAEVKTLVIEGVPKRTGRIITWTPDKGGMFYVVTEATGTYTKAIFDNLGNNVTIRAQADETPIVAFIGPDGLPWILSGMAGGTAARMIYSAGGYFFTGEFNHADCRMIGDRAHAVGSLADGTPRDVWIDFSQPMVDLRTI